MEKKKYTVTYDPLIHGWSCEIMINEEFITMPGTKHQSTTLDCIKTMVDFWYDSKQRLNENNGDYVKTFLKQLASRILFEAANGNNLYGVVSSFDDREGWCKMDGSFGIEILQVDEFDIEQSDFSIE